MNQIKKINILNFFLMPHSILLFCFIIISCNNTASKTDSKVQQADNKIQKTELSNIVPRLDTDGNIVDAHDGRIIKFGNTYYWYGTSYSNTNGFVIKNHYVCYSSNDLKVWKKEGRLLPNQPKGVYYRPHVVYNKKNDNYVLWYNWYPKLWNGQFGVATSKSPQGPFTIKNDNVIMFRSDVGLGDFGLFVDEDETCYLSYNTIQNHQVSIEKLDKDYTASTMENGGIIAEHMEAGSQFKRNGKYYLLTDYTCCFCNYGSGARVYISDNPISGYQLTGNINRYPGKASLVLNDGLTRGTVYETIPKQDSIFNTIEVQFSKQKQVDGMKIHLFTGNRPENCGDVSNPRVHPKIVTPSFQTFFWNYNHWQKIDLKNIEISKSALQETVFISFDPVNLNKIKLVPDAKNYPFDKIYINEIELFSKQEIASQTASFFVTGNNIPQRPIIPAQQTYVMKLNTQDGIKFIWMGDLWGSASDNMKGHDYQYWSNPLQFNDDGTIIPMKWVDAWTF